MSKVDETVKIAIIAAVCGYASLLLVLVVLAFLEFLL